MGPLGVPISNYNLASLSHFDIKGVASSIGERPYLGLFSSKLQAEYSVCEMLTNMVGVYVGDIENIKCSVNWMWPNNYKNEALKLYNTANHLTTCMHLLGVGIDGGKDSLSMIVKTADDTIVSPGNVVITGYSPCIDIYKKVTPDFKTVGSKVILIPFVESDNINGFKSTNYRLKGSIFSKYKDNINNLDLSESKVLLPSSLDMLYVKRVFNFIQTLLLKNKLLSLHDISDGGLITTIFEMCYSGLCGVNIDLDIYEGLNLDNLLFCEEPGVIVEINQIDETIEHMFNENNIKYKVLGNTINDHKIQLNFKTSTMHSTKHPIDIDLCDLMKIYESTASVLERQQCLVECVEMEERYILSILNTSINNNYYIPQPLLESLNKYNVFDMNRIVNMQTKADKTVLILRDEGSNGDIEMGAMFKLEGFEVINYNTNKLIENIDILDKVDGIVFVGGFTYSDLMGAATCWKINLMSIKHPLDIFISDKRKFVVGVCNGFQLLLKLGVFGDSITLEDNYSGRFESRFLPILVCSDKSLFTHTMKDVNFGMWVAHKSGRINIKDKTAINRDFIPVLKYNTTIDSGNNSGNNSSNNSGNNSNTSCDVNYPLNPNGSYDNIAGISSMDGRIIGLMPHFERSYLKYQLPYIPEEYSNIKISPWIQIIKNIKHI